MTFDIHQPSRGDADVMDAIRDYIATNASGDDMSVTDDDDPEFRRRLAEGVVMVKAWYPVRVADYLAWLRECYEHDEETVTRLYRALTGEAPPFERGTTSAIAAADAAWRERVRRGEVGE